MIEQVDVTSEVPEAKKAIDFKHNGKVIGYLIVYPDECQFEVSDKVSIKRNNKTGKSPRSILEGKIRTYFRTEHPGIPVVNNMFANR